MVVTDQIQALNVLPSGKAPSDSSE